MLTLAAGTMAAWSLSVVTTTATMKSLKRSSGTFLPVSTAMVYQDVVRPRPSAKVFVEHVPWAARILIMVGDTIDGVAIGDRGAMTTDVSSLSDYYQARDI